MYGCTLVNVVPALYRYSQLQVYFYTQPEAQAVQAVVASLPSARLCVVVARFSLFVPAGCPITQPDAQAVQLALDSLRLLFIAACLCVFVD